ncbi:FAD-binding domain-containing protein [Mycena metata]|uniref:FAD-binding domain-containing protein n=1 Tax=Mycena metata TaxID=1033252 RepID=A0AAD7JJ14_9AGAR|nr:FAD-binding domain-containing protein [Mycena metata]
MARLRKTCRAIALASIFSSTLALDACTRIQQAVSSASNVYYPVDLVGNYTQDIAHWASSSTQLSACSVEPGTAADVSIILQLLASTNTSFAVKGGGHTANPGFSSTTGVHLSMARFSGVSYDASRATVTIGSGLVWDDVYEALEPYGVNVVGGRASGVGVAGFTLGGGYSWKTNQFGLTVDTITAFELVKPNGSIVSVTASSEPDLFFGLKGGLNNFGIVTEFTLQTFPQGQVWGGLLTYAANEIPAVSAAVARFAANVTDPKAGIVSSYKFILGELHNADPRFQSHFKIYASQPLVAPILFYDGPSPPAGIFDDFLAIPHLSEDVRTRSLLSLVQSASSNASSGATRRAFHTASLLEYSPTMIDAIFNETIFWGTQLALAGLISMSYDIEPFLPSIYTHSTSPSAFPPRDANPPGYLPLNLHFAWTPSTSDDLMHAALRQSAAHLTQVAMNEGQAIVDAPLYTNYALYDTALERIYGPNLPRLRRIKKEVDPGNVMGLAGGFKF